MKVFTLLMLLPSLGFACDFVADTYSTVSESEWKQTLAFAEGGIVTITLEQWDAGEYDKRKAATTQATWSCLDNTVTLTSATGSETFAYSARTALAAIGDSDGFIPGLLGTCATGDCPFAGRYFWEVGALEQHFQ
jgi:hypothetical protein